jgi:hypothetical protein
MRTTLLALPIIAAAGFAALPAAAQPYYAGPDYWNGPNGYPPAAGVVAGAAAGTTVALGAYNGWWPEAALPATAAGAAVTGGIAAVGTLAMVDAVFNPCAGFHAIFDESHGQCVNGKYVGPHAERVSYGPPAGPAVEYRHVRRHHYRHHYRR